MRTVTITRILAGIGGLGALVLGLLIWFAGLDAIIGFHMLFGLTVALTLLYCGILAAITPGMRVLGIVAIIYALGVPVFGLSQFTLLPGSLHWLIQTAHLLVGLGALALIGSIGTLYLRLKRPANDMLTSTQNVR